MASTKPQLRIPNTIFYAMLGAQVFFALGILFFVDSTDKEAMYLFGRREDLYGLIAYAIVMVVLARFMDKTRARSADNLKRVGGNPNSHYLMSVIVRLALLEGAAFMVLTFVLLTHNGTMLWVLLPLFAAFWLARPSAVEFEQRYHQ